MATYGESWLSEVGTQLRSVVDAFWGEVKEHGMLTLLEPVPPFNKPSFLSPAVAVGGLLGVPGPLRRRRRGIRLSQRQESGVS